MVQLKLDIEDGWEDNFLLMAIHSSEEEFKLAYLLNRHLGTRFTRRREDLDFTKGEWVASFPIYDFEDGKNYDTYHLVANKCRFTVPTIENSIDLFGSSDFAESQVQHLFPEFRKVDYFMKIYSDFESISLPTLIRKIGQIKEVISVYEVDLSEIKNKNNLIFD